MIYYNSMAKKRASGVHYRGRLGKQDFDIMEHLTFGDVVMSTLLSSRSTKQFYREATKRAVARYRAKKALERLRRNGYIDTTKENDPHITLTQKGRELLQRAKLLKSTVIQTPAWQGTWTLVLYDIPVSHSTYRYDLRSMLMHVGFRKLQHSVWISPYPCDDLQEYLAEHAGLRRYVRVLTVNPVPGLSTIDDWKKLPVG